MRHDQPSGLDELAAAVARARVAGYLDLYLERRAEVCWRLDAGRVTGREGLLREGAAVRRRGGLASADGLDRPVVAGLLGIPAGALPPFSAPPFPPPPPLDGLPSHFPPACTSLRWRWGWAAVVSGGRAVVVRRPELAEVTLEDGHRALSTWPLPAGWQPEPPPAPPLHHVRPGKLRVLFAPAAAAVLIHELFGHPLEADLLLRGASPWAGKQGERLSGLALDVSDDPTRADLPGSFSADDEGVAAAPRPLLAAGVLVGALADRETAPALGVAAGNARRADVHVPPRPRVANLVAGVAEPLSSPPFREAAVVVASISSGTVEPASGMVLLQVRIATALRRGERHRPLAPFTLVGNLPAVLRGMLAAADPPGAVAEPGWCAKEGEVVATGAVAPWLLLDGLEVR